MTRDKRLPKQHFDKFIAESDELIEHRNKKIQFKTDITNIYDAHSRNISDLEDSILAGYSRGEPMEQVVGRFCRLADYLPAMHKLRDQIPDYVRKEYFSYNDQIRLLSLAILLAPDEERRKIIVDEVSFFSGLEWDCILQVMTNYLLRQRDFARVETNIRWPKMTCLWRAIEDPALTGPMYLQKYVTDWYNNNRGTYWYDYHKDVQSGYFGYWCVEAAATSVMMDIADNDFRANVYYPVDMADWARLHKYPG